MENATPIEQWTIRNEALDTWGRETYGQIWEDFSLGERNILAGMSTLRKEIRELRSYVERIEQEAHESMKAFSSPDAMMDLAGKFLGGK